MNDLFIMKIDIEGHSYCDGCGVCSNSLELTFGNNKICKLGFIFDNHLIGASVHTYFDTVGVCYEAMWCLTYVSSRVADDRISGGRSA